MSGEGQNTPKPVRAPLGDLLTRLRLRLRVLFWLYALCLFTATHWPALEIHVPHIERPDLIIHFTCFGTWFALFWLTGYVGGPLRARAIVMSAIIACTYAGLDEGLQAIPWVRRTCAWDDYFANCGGIAIAAIVAGAVTLLANRPTLPRS